MLSRVETIALEGIRARRVEVEVDLSRGLPALNMVGLPDGAVREARDRIRAALGNSGFPIPPKRTTINLAPADLPKEGSGYDLPMAMGLLGAMGSVAPEQLAGRLFLGELALDGRLKPVPGCLPAALHAREAGIREMIVARENGAEAGLVPGIRVIAPRTILQLVRHLLGESPIEPMPPTDYAQWLGAADSTIGELAEVRGQEYAKRALEVAAAGGHNLVMSGPPGSGKTLLSRCLPGILPPLTLEQALEVTAIYSVSGRLAGGAPLIGARPFRDPHHTASHVALVGGGGLPRPGEVSLAHHGILFLDELTEFARPTLEVLRQPLEGGEVTISRATRSATFPADFQLVAAFNPCPCGHLGNPLQACRCSPFQIERYRSRLSGPLLDRIDLQVEVPPVDMESLAGLPTGEPSTEVRARVQAARERQAARNGVGVLNAHLAGKALDKHAALDPEGRTLLLDASRRLGFSARAFHRILRVARTIADLEGAEAIEALHVGEAIQYRLEKRAA